MAVPAYANDLTDISTAEATTNWDESSDGTWDDGGAATQDADSNIQNTYCVSAEAKVLKTGHMTLIYDNTTDVTIPTDGAVLVWHYYTAGSAIATLANSGLFVLIGDSLGDFEYWATGGNDHVPYPKGGWANVAVNDTVTVKGTVGTPTGSDFIGAGATGLRSISKGNPFCVDVMRYGRCESRFTDGSLGDGYCTFAGFAAANDADNAKWGLIEAVAGGYLYKGLITIGYTAEAFFHDSDATVTIDNSLNVTTGFNAIEIRDVDTEVYWTRVTFASLCTASPGTFEMIDNADVQFTGCSFKDMSTFILLSNFVGLECTWLRCAQITCTTATMTGSSVLLPTVNAAVTAGAAGLGWNVATNPSAYLDEMTFSKGTNAHHAISFGASAPQTLSLTGCDFTGFNAADAANDSTFYFADTGSDVSWTLSLSSCTGNFTYKKARAGDTVTIVPDPVTTLVTVADIVSGTELQGASVLVTVANADNFPYNASINITGSGTTATVTHAAHGMVTGNKIVVAGAIEDEYNGIFTITYASATTYTYTTTRTITATPATGTIIATMAIIYGLTDVNGEIDDERVFGVAQDIEGWVRFSYSGSYYYKQQPISNTISATLGRAMSILLIRDE